LDRDSAVVAEVEFAIMHDGCVIISITVGVDLTSFVFVKIEQLASVDIAHMDNDVIVSVITVLFVMQTNCMSKFMGNNAFNSASSTETNGLRTSFDHANVGPTPFPIAKHKPVLVS